MNELNSETLVHVLSKMLGVNVNRADYLTTQLHGGTLGDVQLITGTAEAVNGEKLPYKVVLKAQKKWNRPGDPNSWRREYDLYASDFVKHFTDSLRWPACYHAELNNDGFVLWLEYIDGISGEKLTIEMFGQAAEDLGRFQGRIFKRQEKVKNIQCLSAADTIITDYSQWKPETVEYRYLYSNECTLPEHLRHMLIATQKQAEKVFAKIKSLPVVLCHKDFWIENIFSADGKIILIDWDCVGWGYMGEDIASLIVDDTNPKHWNEYYRRLIPAYYKGLSENMDVSMIDNPYIREMVIIKYGYRFVHRYMFAKSSDVKNQQIIALQKIYEMGKLQ